MKLVPIAEIADVVSKGTTPTSVGLSFASRGVPFVRGENVNGGEVNLTSVSLFIDSDAHHALGRSALKRGDVLVTIAGTIGRIGYLGESCETANCNQAVAFIRCRLSETDPEWLCLLLQSPEYQRKFGDFVAGGAIPNVSLQQISSIEVPRIDISEQRQIAARLKALLAEVEIARQAAQAQVRDAVLLRQRLLRQTFDALHDAPRKVLGEHAHTTSGVTPSRGIDAYWHPAEVPWVKTGEIDFAPITQVQEFISKKALVECSLSLLPAKTVLVAITGEGKTRGRSAVLGVEATTNQHSVAILPNETWDENFLQLWLQSSYHDLRELSEGRGGSRSALSGGQIRALEVPAPPLPEQSRIVTRLQSQLAEANAIAQAAAAQLAEIERLPQRLLAQAFDRQTATPSPRR